MGQGNQEISAGTGAGRLGSSIEDRQMSGLEEHINQVSCFGSQLHSCIQRIHEMADRLSGPAIPTEGERSAEKETLPSNHYEKLGAGARSFRDALENLEAAVNRLDPLI